MFHSEQTEPGRDRVGDMRQLALFLGSFVTATLAAVLGMAPYDQGSFQFRKAPFGFRPLVLVLVLV